MNEMKSLTLNGKTYDSFVDPVARAMGAINSASGESIAVSDSSGSHLLGLRIYGKTTQDGTPTPDAPVELMSLENPVVTVCGKNLLEITQTTQTSKGITFTVNGDGSVVVNGTATDDVFFHAGTVPCFANTKYRLTGGPSGGSNDTSYMYYVYGSGKYAKDYGSGYEFTPDDDITDHDVIIAVMSGVTVSNRVFYPMLTLASVIDTEYEPHKGQTLTVSTPNGLPGIPVTSGGNYTDANGQQWICDEIDFARGVYVQRIIKRIFDGSENWRLAERDQSIEKVGIFYVPMDGIIAGSPALCNRYQKVITNASSASAAGKFDTNYSQFRVNAIDYETTLDEWVQLLSEWNIQGTPLVGEFAIAAPVETPLSEEEIAAYAALHTYRDHTTVSNDAGAYMELEYVMDAKKYIDSLVKAPPARIDSVTLQASAWVGNASPYSQVVAIDGVTENSQVDLTPSVEQLAVFHHKDLAFVTENVDGVVTVYAIGDKPTNDYSIQVTITEVYV